MNTKAIFANAGSCQQKMGYDYYIDVFVGTSGSPVLYNVATQATGIQPMRTQVEAAADGTLYGLTAGKGIGKYDLTVYEGPFKDGDRSNTWMSRFGVIDTLKEQLIRVVIYPHGKKLTTRGAATFSGYISAVGNTVSENNNLVTIVSSVGIVGQWVS